MKSPISKLLPLIFAFAAMTFVTFSQTITWNRKSGPTGGSVKDVEYDPATGKVFTLIENKIFVSADNGLTWATVTFSGSDDYFYDIEITNGIIYLTTGYDLYTSADGGLTFSKKNNDSVLSSVYKIKRLSTGTLIALSSNRVYYSTTGGTSWVTGASGSFNSNYLVVNNVDQIFAISSGTGLPIRSIDGGATFTTVTNTGISAGGTVFSLTANNSGSSIFCVNAAGLWTSTSASGGALWTTMKGGSILLDAIVASITESASLIEFSGDGLGMYFVDNVNKKLHYKGVSDAITLWQLSAAFPGTNLSVICGSAKNYTAPATSTALFGTFGGLFRTTTGGGTIFDANAGITGVRPNQLVTVYNGDLIMNASSVGLLSSADQGNFWTRITTVPNSVFNLSTNSAADNIFAATGYPAYALYRSQDKGVTWSNLTLPAAASGFRWASGSDNNRVFASSTNNTSLFYSYNNGTTWTATAIAVSGLPASYSFSEYAFSLASSTQLLLQLFNFGTSANEYWRIDFTIGATTTISGVATKIQTTLPFANINKITAANSRFYAYNSSTSPDQVASSSNGGASWTTISAPTSSGNMYVANNGYVFVSSNSDNKLFISRDNGATFAVETALPSTVIPSKIKDIAIDPSGFAYLAVDLEFVHRSNITVVTPAAPSALTLVGKTATGVAMKWSDNSTYDSYYQVERSTDAVNFTNVGQLSSYDICSSPTAIGYYVDKGLTGNTAYTYRVKAVNDAGSSSGITLAVTTLNATTPNIPDNRSWDAVNSGETGNAVVAPKIVSVKHLGGGKYEVSDVSLGVISGYTIRRETFFESFGQTMLITTNGSDPIKPNSNGAWNGTNSITLKWRECEDRDNDAINDTETIALTLRASDPMPLAPTGVSALVVSNSTVEVSWVQGFYEKEYVVERSLTTGSGFSAVATVQYPATSFIDNGPFAIGTTYFYKVKSRNANTVPQDSPYSTESSVVFKTPNFVVSSTTVSGLFGSTIGTYWADFNNDGLEDLFTLNYDFTTEIASPIVFKNLGTGNFLQISISLDQEKYLLGFSADLNNDGFSDIAFSINDKARYDMYRGNGDFTFTKLTDLEKGDIALISNKISGSSTADFNNDGRMDILLLGSNNTSDKPELFKQNVGGSFTKVPGGDLSLDLTEYFSASWADYDNDGDQDFVLASTGSACKLYKNNGNETFTLTSGTGFDATNAFSCAWGDYNNDGNLDLYSAANAQTALYKNNGNGTFTKDVSTSISEAFFGISASWGDINNDGLLDLITPMFLSGPGSRIFINTSTASTTSFTRIVTEKLNDPKGSHYGSGLHDYDKDGFLDVFMSAFYFPPSGGDDVLPVNAYLFKNNNSTGNWTQIKLTGVTSNKRAIGARVIVTASGKTYIREVTSLTSANSQNSPIVHVGIGSTSSITNIQIKWPSGLIQNYPNAPINQVLVVPEDSQSPTIITQSPIAGATSVSTNTTFEVTMSEPSIAVASKSLVVTGVGDPSPFATIAVTAAVKTGNTYSFTLPSALSLNKQYSVTLDAGAFTDIYGNASLALSSGWTFTTGLGPSVVSLTPAHNATGIAAATTLAIQFNGPVTAVVGKNVLLFNKSNLVTPVATLDAGAGVIAGNTVTFTLASKLARQTVYVASIDAGAFKDVSLNDFGGLATTAWEFTTDPGPTVSAFLPANSATNIAVNAPIELTFNKNITAVAGKNIKVLDGTTVLLDVAVSTNGTITGAKYSVPAPVAGWPFLKALSVLVDAGAFVDVNQNDFVGVSSGQYGFTTVEAADVTKPVFATFVPLVSVNKGFGTASRSLDITDNKAVTSAKIFVRGISGTTFTEAVGTFNAATSKWDFALTEASFDAMGVQYYFTAQDAAANEARDPATGYYKTNLKFVSPVEVTTALGFGGQKSNWKIFAQPFETTGSITSLFDELANGKAGVDFGIITYNSAKSWDEYPTFTSFQRGVGYFTNIKNAKAVTLPENLVAPSNTRDNLFKVNLKAGWNMIGNPYLSQISWADVAAYNSLTGQAAELLTYNGSEYVTLIAPLSPYTGGFVFAATAINDVSIPFFGQTTPGGRLKETPVGEGDWMMPIILTQGQTVNELSGVGMNAYAAESFDDLDRVNAPRFFDFIEMNFAHPEHFAKEFSRDVVPTQREYTWEFSVDSNIEGPASMAWNNSNFVKNESQLVLWDVEEKRSIDMRATSHYLFSGKNTKSFRIFFGSKEYIKEKTSLESLVIHSISPNPVDGETNLAFSLAGTAESFVQIRIVNLLGQSVSRVLEGNLASGFHEITWNGKDGQGNRPSPGVYLVEIQQGEGRVSKRLIVK